MMPLALRGAAIPNVAVAVDGLGAHPAGAAAETGIVVFLETNSEHWNLPAFPSWRRGGAKFYEQLDQVPAKTDMTPGLYGRLMTKMQTKGLQGCTARVWVFEPRLAGGGGAGAPALPPSVTTGQADVVHVMSSSVNNIMVALQSHISVLAHVWAFNRQGVEGGALLAAAAAALRDGQFGRGLTLFLHGASKACGSTSDADMLGVIGELFDLARCAHF